MRALPLRPAIYAVAWLALAALAVAGSLSASPLLQTVGNVAQLAAMALTIVWTWQAATCAAGILEAGDLATKARPIRLAAGALLIVVLTGLLAFTIAAPQGAMTVGPISPLLPVGLLAAALGTFALYGLAAYALCAAERAAGTGSPHVLGTAIQFFYLIVGVGFLHRRLRLARAAVAAA